MTDDDRMLRHLEAIAEMMGDDFRWGSGGLEMMRRVSRLPKDEQDRFFEHMNAVVRLHYADYHGPH
jgi:hypothetical protein